MRLISLALPNFKNLHDFVIEFNEESPVAILVGRNGTGKSNVLEASTLIFRDLDLAEPATLDYTIEFECRGRRVRVSGRMGERAVDATIDGLPASSARIIGEGGRDSRPDFVFGYYSGPSNRLEEHFVQHQEHFYRDLVNGVENPLRPLFYARAVHSNFVLLAFFLEEDPEIRNFLREHLGVKRLDSVLFEMQKPSWTSRTGDARFWNARGTVRGFLDNLYRLSLAPMRLEPRVRVGNRRHVRVEHLYLYLPGIEQIQELRSSYGSNQEFFKALESTYISELIYDVRIRVALERAAGALTFRELSEGEQQLLLVLGLMRFTREEQSLFLLDEPDTHLNPAWSAQYRIFLERIGGLGPSSQVLMATHDPLVVSAMTRHEVRILERGDDGVIRSLEPLEDPQGMGVGSLLTSDIYGLRAPVDVVTLERLEKKRLLSSKEFLSGEEAAELAVLDEYLSGLALLTEDRDPDYEEYLRARYRSHEYVPSPEVRTQDQVEADREVAARVLKSVLERRSSERIE